MLNLRHLDKKSFAKLEMITPSSSKAGQITLFQPLQAKGKYNNPTLPK